MLMSFSVVFMSRFAGCRIAPRDKRGYTLFGQLLSSERLTTTRQTSKSHGSLSKKIVFREFALSQPRTRQCFAPRNDAKCVFTVRSVLIHTLFIICFFILYIFIFVYFKSTVDLCWFFWGFWIVIVAGGGFRGFLNIL